MYKSRAFQNEVENKVSRQIECGGMRQRNNEIGTKGKNKSAMQFIKMFSSDKDARIGWINKNRLQAINVNEKFRRDHMLSTSTIRGKAKQEERQTVASSLINLDENIPALVEESQNASNNLESDIYQGEQQLAVKIFPRGGVKTIVNGSSLGISYNGMVVKGNWIPEKGEMDVYHYDGSNLKNTDNMKPEYMWLNDNNEPKKEAGLYDSLKEELCKKKCFQKEYKSKDKLFNEINDHIYKKFAILCYNKGILTFIQNYATNYWKLQFNGYNELY